MLEKLKQDNFWLGVALGTVLPVVVFGLVYFIDGLLSDYKNVPVVIKDSTKYVMAVFVNLLTFRLYMISWRMNNAGKGILAITFFWGITYIMLFQVFNKVSLF